MDGPNAPWTERGPQEVTSLRSCTLDVPLMEHPESKMTLLVFDSELRTWLSTTRLAVWSGDEVSVSSMSSYLRLSGGVGGRMGRDALRDSSDGVAGIDCISAEASSYSEVRSTGGNICEEEEEDRSARGDAACGTIGARLASSSWCRM